MVYQDVNPRNARGIPKGIMLEKTTMRRENRDALQKRLVAAFQHRKLVRYVLRARCNQCSDMTDILCNLLCPQDAVRTTIRSQRMAR
jgi:hypothetical protein